MNEEVKIDIKEFEDWLDNIGEDEYNYLEDLTLKKNEEIKNEIFSKYKNNEKLFTSLKMYRYTNNIQGLRVGGYIRWLDKKNEENWKMLNGGILLKITFTNKGTYIVCKNNNRMMQYLFDKYYTFQKITAEEWMCLMSNEVTNK
jgi:hypothetical protein